MLDVLAECFVSLIDIVGFWRFVFSWKFRGKWLGEWRDGDLVEKILKVVVAAWYLAWGILVPTAIIYIFIV